MCQFHNHHIPSIPSHPNSHSSQSQLRVEPQSSRILRRSDIVHVLIQGIFRESIRGQPLNQNAQGSKEEWAGALESPRKMTKAQRSKPKTRTCGSMGQKAEWVGVVCSVLFGR